jgi:hypothetical protein
MTVMMHREILGLAYGDPRNGDHREPSETLDNRRSNLRIANNGQNQLNSRIRKDNKTGVKGVIQKKGCSTYTVIIKKDGVSHRVGTTYDIEEARILRRDAALKFHGEFARNI